MLHSIFVFILEVQHFRTIPHRSAHSLTNYLHCYQDSAQRLSCIFLLLSTLLLPQWSAWNQEAKKETLHKITLTGLCIGVRRTKSIISSLAEISSFTSKISRLSSQYKSDYTACEVLSPASAINFPEWPRNPDYYPRAPSFFTYNTSKQIFVQWCMASSVYLTASLTVFYTGSPFIPHWSWRSSSGVGLLTQRVSPCLHFIFSLSKFWLLLTLKCALRLLFNAQERMLSTRISSSQYSTSTKAKSMLPLTPSMRRASLMLLLQQRMPLHQLLPPHQPLSIQRLPLPIPLP